MLDACVIGHVTREINKIDGSVVTASAGGVVVYAGIAYRRLGLETKVITKAAPADLETLVRPLHEVGIDVRHFDGGATTLFENTYHGPELGERTQTVRSIASAFEAVDLEGLAAQIVHLGPLTSAEMSSECGRDEEGGGGWGGRERQGLSRKGGGGGVRMSDRPDLGAALPCIDILKIDAEEARTLSHERDPEAAARALAAFGPREVIVTLGAAGALICAQGRIERVPAVRPNALADPTGCGDSSAAGYAHGGVARGNSCLPQNDSRQRSASQRRIHLGDRLGPPDLGRSSAGHVLRRGHRLQTY